MIGENVCLVLQCGKGTRVELQSTIEVGQRAFRVVGQTRQTSGNPALLVGRLQPHSRLAIAAGPLCILCFGAHDSAEEVDLGLRRPELFGASQIGDGLLEAPRPS